MLTFCKVCSLKVGQIKSYMIWGYVVKLLTFVIFSDCQDPPFVLSNKASVLRSMLKNVFDVDFNVSMRSGCIGLRLEFPDPILEPFPEVLACTFEILIVAFFYNKAGPWAVKAKVSRVLFLIFSFRWAFHRLCLWAFALSVQVQNLFQYEIKSRLSLYFFGLIGLTTIV